MSTNLRYCLHLVWPLLAAALFLFLNFHAESLAKGQIDFTVWGVNVTVTSRVIVHVLVNLAALVCGAIFAFRDYGGLFAERWKIQVFFDVEGIAASLGPIPNKEWTRRGLKLADSWRSEREEVMKELNGALRQRVPGISFRFFDEIHSEGHVDFEVEEVKGSWQTYRIAKSSGQLRHTMSPMEGTALRTEFRLLDSGSCYVQLSLIDLFVRWRTTIRPTFVQTLLSADDPVYEMPIVCVTTIRFFPVPVTGNTVHCVERGPEKRLVPISYAVNRI